MRGNHALTVQVIFGIHSRLESQPKRCTKEFDLKAMQVFTFELLKYRLQAGGRVA